MQEPHEKGIANRLDPESCAGGGNIAGEALTGAHAGQPSSSEITLTGVPILCDGGEGHKKGDAKRKSSFDTTESQTLCMRGNSLHGNRETPEASASTNAHEAVGCAERPEKACGWTSGMHAFGESDGFIVPKKRANKAGCSAAESVEERGPTQGNEPQAWHVPDTEPERHGNGLWGVRAAVMNGWSSDTRGRSRMR